MTYPQILVIIFIWNQESKWIRVKHWWQSLILDNAVIYLKFQTKDISPPSAISNAHVLLNVGDSVTTDHISPAGSIARTSPAARYLAARGLTPREFNSYGSRRGNDAVMARGTFANIRLVNKFIGKAAPKTIHVPSGDVMDVFDAAERYRTEGTPLIILAGKDYGCGSSRDWAAKGPWMQVQNFTIIILMDLFTSIQHVSCHSK